MHSSVPTGEAPVGTREGACAPQFQLHSYGLAMSTIALPLPKPPENLSSGEVLLRFANIVAGDSERGLVPYYHFRILDAEGTDVGHINFRVGDNAHVQLCAGHIGYEVQESFRGHGYALKACRALAPFVRVFYSSVIITSDPDNHASLRTIERLGASFIDEIEVPPHDPQYQRGSRRKKRYRWMP